MSAFDRLPQRYRDQCELYSKHLGKFEGLRRVKLSPQNRRVRYAVDHAFAAAKTFPNVETRQQRRAATKPWKKRVRGQ